MRKLIVVHGGKPPSLKHAHNDVILLRGTGLFSVCMAVNMFTHSLDNALQLGHALYMWFVNS